MVSPVGSWSIACLLHPDFPDASSLRECTSGDQHVGSFQDTLFAAKLLTLKSRLHWHLDYSLASFPVPVLAYIVNFEQNIHKIEYYYLNSLLF